MNEIIGFENEFKIISKNLLNHKLNNAILIKGNKGIGKFYFTIKIIENYLNKKINSDQINHHLLLLNNHSHPNLKVLKKLNDEKTNKIKNNITIDQIRELTNYSLETSLIENIPKFIIIDSADDLNLNSSNALLKILEEPKNNTYFFLISHQSSSLLSTIKSRCIKLNLPKHNFNNFKKILLSQNLLYDEELFKFLFDVTDGSPGLSLDFNFDEILEVFNQLIYSITEVDALSEVNHNISIFLSSLENEKFRVYLSLIKFILLILKKIKVGINITNIYFSKNILEIEKFSDKISLNTIDKKFDYLINNQNDLFTFNLDKKLFMINFFAEI